MKDNISIVRIGKIVGKCYDEFEDVWTGYDLFRNLESKIGVNIAREYGTQFVEKFCNIKIINYL